MKKMKFVSALLLMSIAMGTLVGCSTTTEQPTADSKPADSKPADSKPADDKKEPEVAAEPGELKIHFHANNKYTLNNADGELLPVFALAGEKTNIEVESVANAVAQNSLQTFQLEAAQGFKADIYGGTGIRTDVISYGYQGAFMPLNDLIDEHGPNIKAYLEANPDVKKAMTSADGNMYMLNYNPDGDVARTFFIRTDWLDTLGLPMPTNFDELEKTLYAFRNDDPNGNGEKDEVPLFNDKWEELIRTANLWGARVYGFDSFAERVVLDENDQFYHAWIAPEFKEAMIGMSKWYADGIIDPEVFSRKLNTSRATLWTKENRGGMTHDFFASTSNYNYNDELLASTPDFKVEPMLPVNKNGEAFAEHQRALSKPDGWAISAQCKDPVAAIRYMDWFYSEEGRRAINFGIEGETYTMVNNEPIFTDEVLSQPNVLYHLQSEYGAQLPIGYKQNYDYEEQWISKEGKAAYDMYSANDAALYSVPPTPILNLTEEEQEVVDRYLAPLNDYQDETVTAFIMGKIDVETGWDEYVKKCEALGAQELVKVYEGAYARYKEMK